MQSTTPEGTPPRNVQQSFGSQQSTNSAPAPDTSAILAALATMAKQNTSTSAAPTTNSYAAQDNTNNVTNAQNAVPQPVPSSVNQAPFLPPLAQPVNVPTSGATFPSQFAGGMNDSAQSTSNAQPNPLAALAAMLPQTNVPGGADALQQQLVILQQLAQAGVPQDQWATLLAAINPGGLNVPVPSANNGFPSGWPQPEHAGGPNGNGWSGRDEFQSRDRNGLNEQSLRSPPNRYRPRSRSRSPSGWARGHESPVPRRRDSPIYGEYNGDGTGRNANRGDNFDRRGRGRGGRGRGDGYRQRSPPPGRNGRSSSPRRQEPLPPPGPKWVDYDPSIGQGNIKGMQAIAPS